MAGFQNLVSTLRKAEAQLEKQLEGVRNAIAALTGAGGGTGRGPERPAGKRGPGRPKGPGKRKGISAAGRAAIAAAQKKRWAKLRREGKAKGKGGQDVRNE